MTKTNEDRMTLEVLDDGTAVLKVDGISGANHAKADQIVAEFARLLGGELKTRKRPEAHSHSHAHSHRTHSH